ncbi:MAG: amino acid permease [Longimicrobiales bacterium]
MAGGDPARGVPTGGRLSKELKLFDVFAISTGAMFSSGFFLLPGLASAEAGPAVVLAYLLAGLLVVPAMLSKAELSTAMPRAGGPTTSWTEVSGRWWARWAGWAPGRR